jgi:hypothetical protein
MKQILILCAVILAGCKSVPLLSNDQIIQERATCAAAGMGYTKLVNMYQETYRVECRGQTGTTY